MYSIGGFTKKIGISIQTLKYWDKSVKLKLAYRNKCDHKQKLNEILQKIATNKRINVGVRVRQIIKRLGK